MPNPRNWLTGPWHQYNPHTRDQQYRADYIINDDWKVLAETGRSDSDRSRYTAALKGAMEANYLAKMRQGKKTDIGRIRTEITGEEQQGTHTVVHTKIDSGGETAAIDYVMERRPKGWRAVDVITEGVSLAETYREQVAKILAKKSLNDVIAALDRKRKTLEADENKPASG